MMSYRVYHTLQYPERPESLSLLEHLETDAEKFTEMVRSQPETLAHRILETDSPSIAAYLSFQEQPDHASIMKDLKDNKVFIAHMSEQGQMLSALFGRQPDIPHENSSHKRKGHKNASPEREGLAAEFADLAQPEWALPFVDPESSRLYQSLESSGIVDYWKNGGTREGYLELLKNL
ncbi:MAG: hypothetical protein KDI17_15290 [Halioglobus sp.]|nr:hypothetical protein [Halioglobus sp.]